MWDVLGERMKTNYESISKTKLVRRMPVIIRLDGKAFHSYTKNFVKPFDYNLIEAMHETMKYLCENIQGCVLGYHQSDEISLLLIDYKHLNSSAWFDNEVQKICSVSASMATGYFNKCIKEKLEVICKSPYFDLLEDNKLSIAYQNVVEGKLAFFDSRCFNIPKEEVTNYFYWRQQDAIRNAISMVGQHNFSHSELQYKSSNEVKQMLLTEKGIDFDRDFSCTEQRGVCCLKSNYIDLWRSDEKESCNSFDDWIIDEFIPVFKGDGREYIENILDSFPEEE